MNDVIALKNLTVKATIGGISKIEPFNPDTTTYRANVQSDIDKISITPEAENGYSIQINGSYTASGKEYLGNLLTGENIFQITVEKGQNKKMYTVYVSREDITDVINGFERTSYFDNSTDITLNYNLFVPIDYDKSKKYPLVLFLHGAGERGDDSLVILTSNQGATIWAKQDEQEKRPCIVLAPQCPMGKGWTTLMTRGFMDPFKPTDYLDSAYDLLQKIIGTYNIDTDRLYCTGVSMGGFGTWALNIKHPELFAAIVPICGFADNKKVGAIAKKPMWIATAVKDPLINVGSVRKTIEALKAQGAEPIYKEYPEDAYFYPMAHFSWVPAYADEDLRKWLFEQKLSI